MAKNNNSIYLKEKAAQRRTNDLKKGRHYKEILKLGGAVNYEEKSDLYFNKGNIWADNEREWCGKITNSKFNGFNPSHKERKQHLNLEEQLQEYLYQ